MTTRRRTFTVRPEAHRLYACGRCNRRILRGERCTATITPGLASFKHAGRTCPPTYNYRPTP